MDVTIASLIGVVIGAIAGVGGSIAVAVITRRSEERRHLREIVLRTSLENWRETMAFGKSQIEQGHSVSIFPLESYIIPMRKITDILERDNLTIEEARRCVREYITLNEAVSDEFYKHDQKKSQNKA